MKKFLAIRLVTLSVFGLVLFPGKLLAEPDKPLRVGVILPLTGVAALPGLHLKNGILLAKEELLRRGDSIELEIEDSKTDPKASVSAYQKYVSVSKVDAVIGDIWDFLVSPLIPLSKSAKIPTISPMVMDFVGNDLDKSEYFWSLGSKVSSLEPATAKFLELQSGKKKAAIFCWNNFWGEAHLREWKKILAKHGRTIVSEQCEGDFSSDLRALSLKINAAKPELILVSTLIGVFAKRLSEFHSEAAVLSTSDILEELQNPGFDKALVEGWYFVQWLDPADFSAKYQEKYGIPPLHEASKGYYTLYSLAEAWKGRKENESLTDSLRRLKLRKSDGGVIDFSKQPFANDTIGSLFQVRSAKAVEVYTPPLSE